MYAEPVWVSAAVDEVKNAKSEAGRETTIDKT